MKTNSLFKRLVSMLIVVLMICTLFPMTAFAATDIEISPNKKPSDYNYTRTTDGPTKDHGTIEKEVGDTGAFVRCPSNTVYGSYCGHSLGTFYPVAYCDIKVELSNPEIIGDISYSKGYLNNSECLQMNFTAKKAGTPKVKLTYYCNFMIDVWGGYCPRCGVWTYGQRIYTWYKYTDTFTVFVSGDPSEPEKPNDDTVKGLLTNAVKIDCEKHDDKTYGLLANSSEEVHDSYSIGEVEGDATNGYTCDITVKRGKYIDAYNGTYEGHTADENDYESKTITLKYQDDGTWAVYNNTAPVTFNVKCVTPDPINWETGLSVQKVATNTTSGTVVNTVAPGEEITYTITVKNETGKDLTDIEVSEVLNPNLTLESISPENANYENGVWTISSLENGDTATLTINVKVKDEVPDKTEIKNIATIIAATAGNDSLPGGIRPTGSSDVKVSAPEEPKVPDAPSYDELKGLLNVTINCINTEASHKYKTQTYGLLPNSENKNDSYSIGEPQKDEKTGVYTCVITVYPTLYVNTYDEQTGAKHKLDPDTQVSATITLIYVNNYGWDVARAERSTAPAPAGVTFNVVCEKTPVTTYTVTYKDGVGGKVFKDDVHTVESGATTPAFVGGIPTRPGYVFVGWTPAVSKTVTDDATYTATWRKVKDTTVIEIGGGNSSSSSSKEENPNTGAPVFVGVSVGALAAAK